MNGNCYVLGGGGTVIKITPVSKLLEIFFYVTNTSCHAVITQNPPNHVCVPFPFGKGCVGAEPCNASEELRCVTWCMGQSCVCLLQFSWLREPSEAVGGQSHLGWYGVLAIDTAEFISTIYVAFSFPTYITFSLPFVFLNCLFFLFPVLSLKLCITFGYLGHYILLVYIFKAIILCGDIYIVLCISCI